MQIPKVGRCVVICRTKDAWVQACKEAHATPDQVDYWVASKSDGLAFSTQNGRWSAYCRVSYYTEDRSWRDELFIEYQAKYSEGSAICADDAGDGWGELPNLIKNSMTSLKALWKDLNRSEPEKTFIREGILDEDREFTTEGKSLFNAFLLEKYGEEFKTTVLDPIIKEREAKEKK
jgi:hypothetical protein